MIDAEANCAAFNMTPQQRTTPEEIKKLGSSPDSGVG